MATRRLGATTGEEYLALPSVRQHIADAAAYAAQETTRHVVDECETYLIEQPLGSPLEAIFAAWWLGYSAAHKESGFGSLDLAAQYEVPVGPATYRLDFSVFSEDADTLYRGLQYGIRSPDIGVELDGHEFHERTKEQVERRNRRDRDLLTAGWTIFHYAGSELVRDPLRAVREVWEAGESSYIKFFSAVYEEDRRRGRSA